MIDAKKEDLEFITKIINKHVDNCEIRVFGSRVKGNSKRYSDIDICIVAASEIGWKTLCIIKEEFAGSELPYRVDVIDWNGVGDNFKRIISEKYEIINP